MPDPDNTITAYVLSDNTGMPIEPAPVERDWMEEQNRFAYRCLPLNIANQCGWVIRNPTAFTAHWNGGETISDLVIEFGKQLGQAQSADDVGPWTMTTTVDVPAWADAATAAGVQPDPRITSHFGSGVVTFSLPYLFRTPPGVNLWVKGPSNWVKHGAQPLEGVVEADWNPATFTMNWKLTARGSVRFERGEPVCMIVPVPRGYVEKFTPRVEPITVNEKLMQEYRDWQQARKQFLVKLRQLDPETVERGWQKEYFIGRTPEGGQFPSHQTRLEVKPFTGDRWNQ